jgi:hypothetical protein
MYGHKYVGAAAGTGVLITGGQYLWNSKTLNELAKKLISEDSLESSYRRIYSRRIADKDAFTASLWKRVFAHIQLGLSSTDLQALEKLRASDHALLEKVFLLFFRFYSKKNAIIVQEARLSLLHNRNLTIYLIKSYIFSSI